MGTKISELIPPAVKVETGRGSFEVRGLTLDDIVYLVKTYKESFARLLVVGESGVDYSEILQSAPEMVRDIIALGAGVLKDEVEVAAISLLPGMTQIDALTLIWKETVPDPKKLQALLLTVLNSIKNIPLKNDSTGPEGLEVTPKNKLP